MKMIMLADLHLGLQEDNSLWHKASLTLADAVHDSAVKNDIDTIALLGDVFDNRKSISQKTHDIAIEIFTRRWSDFKVILTRGNHDTYYKDNPKPNWLNMFKDSPNVTTVETEPYFLGDFCFVPWAYDVTSLDWNGYLFGHFEINSFKMNNFYECKTSSLGPHDFSRFRKVYSGHFHFPQTYGNVSYLGSPFQQNFGDVSSKRGYYILDDNIEFIEFTKAPKFVIIKTNEPITPEKVKGNIVKIVFDKDYGTRKNNNLIEDIELMEPAALVGVDTSSFAIDSILNDSDNDNEIVIKDNKTLLRDYIDIVVLPEHLKKKTMLTMMDMLLKEIASEED